MSDARFGEHYPVEYNQKIFDLTERKWDYLFLSYLISNAFLQKTDTPLIDAKAFINHFKINEELLAVNLKKLRKAKIIIPQKDDSTQRIYREARWHVPMVSWDISKLIDSPVLTLGGGI